RAARGGTGDGRGRDGARRRVRSPTEPRGARERRTVPAQTISSGRDAPAGSNREARDGAGRQLGAVGRRAGWLRRSNRAGEYNLAPSRRPTWGGGAEGIMGKATRGTSAATAAKKTVQAKAGSKGSTTVRAA